MLGYQKKTMPLFISGNLDEFVPRDHLLRNVEAVINLEFIREVVKPLYSSAKGRPSIDPIVFFKLQIIAYLYGITSDRRLCEEVQCNLAYRWYLDIPLDEAVPDHSSISRIRDRLGTGVFKMVFEKIIDAAKRSGFIEGKQIITDASLIKADASRDSFVERPEEEKEIPDSGYVGKNKTHVSRTDPESSLVMRSSKPPGLYYKVHTSIDSPSRMITDCHVTPGATHECKVIADRLDFQKNSLNLPILAVSADKGYGHGEVFADLAKLQIEAFIPLKEEKVGRGVSHENHRHFEYISSLDKVRCNNGYLLNPGKIIAGHYRFFTAPKKVCSSCAFKEQCYEGQPSSRQSKGRFYYRSLYQEEFEKARETMKTNQFQEKMIERKWSIEGIFAEAKNNHCMSRARYRGKSKVQIQVYMVSIVQNLKRLMNRRLNLHFTVITDHFKCHISQSRYVGFGEKIAA